MQEQLKDIQRYEEDEIDLKELIKTIWKNKIKILLITIVITSLAIVYAYSKVPIFEVKSNVQIGFIGKNLITDPRTLVKELKIIFNVEDKVETNEKFVSEVSNISINKKLKKFIEIKTQAISIKEALKKNKEVVAYIANKYKVKIDQFTLNNNNKIKALLVQIKNADTLERKNLERKIQLLNTQAIVKIEKEIEFFKKTKINNLKNKRKLYQEKLKQYTSEIKKIYKNNKNSKDTATLAISSIQMVNYQNLILDSQNKIEDLKVEVETIKFKIIPSLENKKENLINDTFRKLEYQLHVNLPDKIVKLNEEINRLAFNTLSQNLQNSTVVGNYIVKSNPIKPKKKLIVVVAFITGLILSVFLVFFLEFIKGFKKEDFED